MLGSQYASSLTGLSPAEIQRIDGEDRQRVRVLFVESWAEGNAVDRAILSGKRSWLLRCSACDGLRPLLRRIAPMGYRAFPCRCV
jgi:hypothetical protein